jgi:hypothetical protein
LIIFNLLQAERAILLSPAFYLPEHLSVLSSLLPGVLADCSDNHILLSPDEWSQVAYKLLEALKYGCTVAGLQSLARVHQTCIYVINFRGKTNLSTCILFLIFLSLTNNLPC